MFRIAVVLSAVALAGMCYPAWAEEASPAAGEMVQAEEKPLLVIRFNQKRVYFDRALSMAVKSAEKAKSGVMYDVVSYVPYKGENKSKDERTVRDAQVNLQSVVANMYDLGVPASRINAGMKAAPSAGNQEIHIFVR